MTYLANGRAPRGMSRAALAQFVGFNKLVESQSSSNKKKGADELKVKLQTGPSKKGEEEVGGRRLCELEDGLPGRRAGCVVDW